MQISIQGYCYKRLSSDRCFFSKSEKPFLVAGHLKDIGSIVIASSFEQQFIPIFVCFTRRI